VSEEVGDVPFLTAEPRDRLLAAVAALCSERGYEEISEEQIAGRAGVSRQTFEELFADGKEGCLAAAEDAILLEVVSAVSQSYRADRAEWESVIYGAKALLELMAKAPEFAYLGYIFSRQMAPARVREINEAGHRMLEAMLERGWDYSQSTDQPAYAALGVLGGAQAIIRHELVHGRASELPKILPDCVYCATVPFLGQEQALRLSRDSRQVLDSK
jgi:AcrR family transcriptional regulator